MSSVDILAKIAERERTPMYIIGEVTGDNRFVRANSLTGEKPVDLTLESFFGNPPRTIMNDISIEKVYSEISYDKEKLHKYIEMILQLEEVACKDWLTNKVDRSVSGRIAKQQCAGPLQLPLNNTGVIA